MTTPTTPTPMTLPPCPIAGHDNPHHWHGKWTGRVLTHDRHSTKDCDTEYAPASRCYSAHVPEPTPDPDEPRELSWDEAYWLPAGTVWEVRLLNVATGRGYSRKSSSYAILKPAPTPAEKLAEALCATYAPDGDEPAWTPADVLAALDAAGLTLAERGEK